MVLPPTCDPVPSPPDHMAFSDQSADVSVVIQEFNDNQWFDSAGAYPEEKPFLSFMDLGRIWGAAKLVNSGHSNWEDATSTEMDSSVEKPNLKLFKGRGLYFILSYVIGRRGSASMISSIYKSAADKRDQNPNQSDQNPTGRPIIIVIRGTGGNGGKGSRLGGSGGCGEASQLAVEVGRFFCIHGGVGGHGGDGGAQGGDSGLGQGPKLGTKLVAVPEKAGGVPTLSVTQFCQDFHVSNKIRNLLVNQGFETAGALLEVSDISLLDVGLKVGQIAEMKRALTQFLDGPVAAQN
ncbi:hypothetical protein FB451DRAFT_1186658 [Mycena latifolia]|nr:hypothetical protein FB451DRAFT_1186658 [Mycena latifolia]